MVTLKIKGRAAGAARKAHERDKRATETRLHGCAGSLARSGLRFEKFPCKAGKNREIGGNPANFMKTAAQCCRNFKALRDEFPGMSIREFLRASREVTASQFSRYRESL
jgi:hypothetical protein